MTTAFLNPVPGDHNLQALRDFALEAPFEWRKEFEELIELREDAVEIEEVEERLDAVKDAARDAIKSLEQSVLDFRKALGELTPAVGDALDDHEKEVAQALKDLAGALDDDEGGPAQQPVVLKVVKP